MSIELFWAFLRRNFASETQRNRFRVVLKAFFDRLTTRVEIHIIYCFTLKNFQLMIDFSVYMMRNPLKPELPEKAYAKNQVSEIWPLEKFAKHIADHNGVFSRGTVKGVLSDTCECLVEQLLNGKKVELGELGTFGISLSSEGAPSVKEFSAKNIKAVNILFAPGPDFVNLINRAEFNLVTSRAVQAAALSAVKEGMDTVDLTALRKDNSTETPSGSDPNGSTSNPSGGNENPGSGSDSPSVDEP